MRIDYLTLVRYGHFQSLRLEFPSSANDLHVLFGQNEAGKSTIRRAVAEWLYGIHPRTTMALGYPSTDLLLEGSLSGAGAATEFRRKKTKSVKDSLVDLSGAPLAASLSARFPPLQLSREAFEQMFCMGAEELHAGAETLLNAEAKDEFAVSLWQSATGLADMGQRIKALRQAEDDLWGPRQKARGARKMDSAKVRLDEATRRLKEASTTRYAADQADRDLATASAANAAALGALRALQAESSALQATILGHPAWLAFVEAEQRAGLLPAPLPYPATAVDRLQRAIASRQVLQSQIASAREDVANLSAAGLSPDEVGRFRHVVASSGLLEPRVEQALSAAQDLPGLLAEVDAHWQALVSSCSAAGLPPPDLAALPLSVPDAKARAALVSLSGAVDQQRAAVHQAEALALSASEDLERVRADSPVEPTPVDPDVPAAVAHLEAEVAAAAQSSAIGDQERALGALVSRHFGNLPLEKVLSVDPPSAEVSRAAGRARTEATRALQAATASRAVARSRAQALEAKVSESERALSQSLTDEALTGSRQRRDSLFGELVADPQALAGREGEYRGLVLAADEIADQRMGRAAEVGALRSLRLELAGASAESEAADQEVSRCAAELDRVDSKWQRLLADGGWPTATPDEVAGWAAPVADIRAAAERVRTDRARAESLAARVDAALYRLGTLVGQTFQSPAEAFAWVKESVRAQSTAADAFRRHQDALRAAGQRREQAAGRVIETRATVAPLVERYAALLTGLGYDPALSTDQVRVRMEAVAAVERSQSDYLRDNRRVTAMDQTVTAFRTDLASALEVAQEPPATSLPEGVARLRARAQACRRSLAEDEQRQSSLARARSTESAKTQELGSVLADVRELEGVYLGREGRESPTLEALLADVQASLEVQTVRQGLDSARRALLAAHPSKTLDQVRDAYAAFDIDAARASAVDQADRLDALGAEVSAAGAKLQEAQAKVDRIGDGSDYRVAAADREAAMSTMEDAATRWLSLHLQRRLLEIALERYRQKAQGPMVDLASSYFSRLTGGRYRGVQIETDADKPQLVAVLANGQHVAKEHLSEGTLKPLFLALRLASLVLYGRTGGSYLFLADDLFVEMDDERVELGFQLLSELSASAQILYFTHHQHLVAIAQRVLPTANVIALPKP